MDKLILFTLRGDRPFGDRLAPGLRLPEGMTAVEAGSADEIAAHPDATILVTNPGWLTQEMLDSLPNLRWLQCISAGTDPLAALRLPAGCQVTSASGVHAPQMTELLFFFMLGLLRDVRSVLARQDKAQWQPAPQRLLAGRTLLVVGVGAIAEALALRCNTFGMRVVGLSAHRTEAPGFAAVRPMAELHAALGDADIVVILTPHTTATHHLIDAPALAAMRSNAFLINVARGAVVDTAALVDALRAETIAGAGLDVFEEEPLPDTSPLWRMRNVLMTPHIGGWSDFYNEQLAPFISENLRCWAEGRPLHNLIVDGAVARR
jgi:phosphoglycerate dehydrogenase-like enzyme